MALIASSMGAEFIFEWNQRYILSLIYLIIFSSIIAFLTYLTLLQRIGPGQAAYATVIFPIGALIISTIVEGYQWTLLAAIGVCAVLLGCGMILFFKTRAGAVTQN